MLFSIVVPVFNGASYLERCIRALLSQRFPADGYEIIVVDNNSTDRTVAIARSFDRVRLLHESEQGSYAARNLGVRQARGAIVAFTDSDCEPRADWLEQIQRAMFEPLAGVVLGDRRFASDAGISGMLAAYESALGANILTAPTSDCCYAYTNNMAVRMSILKDLGGFRNLKRGADGVFLRHAMERHGRRVLRYAPEVVVRHLEIAGIRNYLDKKIIYGRVNGNRELATPASLPLSTRLSLALQVPRRRGGSPATKLGFLGVLAAGAMRFEWERWRAGH